mmetsp:Transcript_14864/g.29995  ORF Transcript_14864/g.29995 Transcript_14864/m.29995 type:complete len:205 (-) Transcript_14864:249-863(-)
MASRFHIRLCWPSRNGPSNGKTMRKACPNIRLIFQRFHVSPLPPQHSTFIWPSGPRIRQTQKNRKTNSASPCGIYRIRRIFACQSVFRPLTLFFSRSVCLTSLSRCRRFFAPLSPTGSRLAMQMDPKKEIQREGIFLFGVKHGRERLTDCPTGQKCPHTRTDQNTNQSKVQILNSMSPSLSNWVSLKRENQEKKEERRRIKQNT